MVSVLFLPALFLVSETSFYPRFRVIVTTLINIGPTMLTFGGLVLVSAFFLIHVKQVVKCSFFKNYLLISGCTGSSLLCMGFL